MKRGDKIICISTHHTKNRFGTNASVPNIGTTYTFVGLSDHDDQILVVIESHLYFHSNDFITEDMYFRIQREFGEEESGQSGQTELLI